MMFDFSLFLSHSGLYVTLATIFLMLLVLYNPRLMLQDYPPAIQEVVPQKTDAEKRQSIWLGLPFLLTLSFSRSTPRLFFRRGPAAKREIFLCGCMLLESLLHSTCGIG